MTSRTKQDAPAALIEEALTSARRSVRYGRKARKALDSIRHEELDAASVPIFVRARDTLAGILGKSGSEELEERVSEWLDSTAAEIDDAICARKRQLLEDIQEGAEQRGVAYRRLGDTPLTVALGAFQIEIESGHLARIKLGLEPIAETEPTAEAVFEACEGIRQIWNERTPPIPELFERLHRAYRMACAGRGNSPDERVELVDLLGSLALAECDHSALRKKGLAAVEEYPRHLLARQLTLLNREGALERDGFRLELGAATGGSTQNKRDVLYVQSSPTRGQYFLTIRFAHT